jgi:uncharacterized lipoprotein YajG
MMFKKITLLFAIAILVSACAYTPHDVQIDAQAPIINSTAGEGTKLGLRIFDDRPSTTVGQRGAMNMGADITANQLMDRFEDQVNESYEAQGFEIVEYNDPSADARLEASMRNFDFFIESGFWTGANNVDIVIKADAENGRKTYAETYRFQSEERMLVVPDAEKISASLNAGLTDVLTKMTTDSQLKEVLTSE